MHSKIADLFMICRFLCISNKYTNIAVDCSPYFNSYACTFLITGCHQNIIPPARLAGKKMQ